LVPYGCTWALASDAQVSSKNALTAISLATHRIMVRAPYLSFFRVTANTTDLWPASVVVRRTVSFLTL
jgi:hypothetical protein